MKCTLLFAFAAILSLAVASPLPFPEEVGASVTVPSSTSDDQGATNAKSSDAGIAIVKRAPCKDANSVASTNPVRISKFKGQQDSTSGGQDRRKGIRREDLQGMPVSVRKAAITADRVRISGD